jgi:hypothetical protein
LVTFDVPSESSAAVSAFLICVYSAAAPSPADDDAVLEGFAPDSDVRPSAPRGANPIQVCVGPPGAASVAATGNDAIGALPGHHLPGTANEDVDNSAFGECEASD